MITSDPCVKILDIWLLGVEEVVEDGREAEGISRLTGADINAAATVFASLLTIMDVSAQTAINKPCVRPLLYNSPD